MYFSCTFFTNIEKLRNRRVHEIMKNLGVICLFLHYDKSTYQAYINMPDYCPPQKKIFLASTQLSIIRNSPITANTLRITLND